MIYDNPVLESIIRRYRGSVHRRALSLHGRLTGWAEIMPQGAALARPLWRAETNWRAHVCADQRIRRTLGEHPYPTS